MCVGVPGKILEITGDEALMRMGKVSFGGTVREISLAYLPDAKVGDHVIVHAGFAISILNEEEAKQVFEYLEQIEYL